MKLPRLTDKQQRFVEEYCVSFNATRAGEKAGYSMTSTNTFVFELLSKRHIQDAIAQEKAKLSKKTGVTALRVLQELVAIGFSDIGHVVQQAPDGTIEVRNLEEMLPHIRAGISSIECKETGTGRTKTKTTKVNLHPKLPALDAIIKMLGYDKASLEKELVVKESRQDAEMLDPKTFTKEQWEVFKELNAKRLEALKP